MSTGGYTVNADYWAKYWENERERRRRKANAILIPFIVLASILCIVLLIKGDEIDYGSATRALERGEYKKAYNRFDKLGTYMDSQYQKEQTVYAWTDYVIAEVDADAAQELKNTVEPSSAESEGIYIRVWELIERETYFSYWEDNSSAPEVVLCLLETIPGEYMDTTDLQELFRSWSERWQYTDQEYIRNNMNLLREHWDIAFLQDYLQSDDGIITFLEGNWYTSDYSHSMEFYPNSDGGTSFDSTLPQVEKPSYAVYFDIQNRILCWTGYGSISYRDVYRFEFLDANTVEVYCYENSRTYTLYRYY